MSNFPEHVLEYFIDGVIIANSQGTITCINQSACDLLNTSPVRNINKQKVSDLLQVDGSKYDLNLLSNPDVHSVVAKISTPNKSDFEARLVTIPRSICGGENSILVLKDLSHEEELFQKYQSQIKLKDRKIHESQVLNSILQKIRLTKDPHTMIRQIAFSIMNEIKSEVSLMVTAKANNVSCDIITGKENRSKYMSLLSANDVNSEEFPKKHPELQSRNKATLPAPLNRIWPTDHFLLLNLYEGYESIFVLVATDKQISGEDSALIRTIRDQTSISIASSHFEKLSHIDELTGVYNRRYFIQQSQVFFSALVDSNKDCAVVMLDIDHFKMVNDVDGHLFGDEVLRNVGGLLQRNSRISDIIARYGGEEFIAFLPETNSTEAQVWAERIRLAIQNQDLHRGDSPRKVTASFGIASLAQSGAKNLEQLIDYSDRALYVSKATGRNRASVFGAK